MTVPLWLVVLLVIVAVTGFVIYRIESGSDRDYDFIAPVFSLLTFLAGLVVALAWLLFYVLVLA